VQQERQFAGKVLFHWISLFHGVFQSLKIICAAQGEGVAQGALEMALKNIIKREEFAIMLWTFQMIQGELAEIAAMTEAAGKIENGKQ